jgi:hypothetical protein
MNAPDVSRASNSKHDAEQLNERAPLNLAANYFGSQREINQLQNKQRKNMKTCTTTSALQGGTRLARGLLAAVACLIGACNAQAHLTYSGRDFGAFSGQTNGTKPITNQTCTGNFGWADAADGILGDSHKGRAFRFHLDNTALVTLTVAANPAATTNSLGDLTPGFSIYSGLAGMAPFPPSQTTNPPSADHDFGAASVAWRVWWVQQNLNPSAEDESPTDGSWNALGNWRIGGDGDLPGDFSQLSGFTYKGSAASTTSGSSVTGTFALPAGDYTILIGGNDIANKTSGTAALARGIAATLTVTPAPALSIAEKVFVAWPAGIANNWVLESAPSTANANWTGVPNAPVTLDGQPGVLLDKSTTQQFFRLNFIP